LVIAIDLGSNTFRVALIKKEQNGFNNEQIYEKIVGAARGLNESGKIGLEAKNRLFEAIAEAKSKNLTLLNLNAWQSQLKLLE